MPWDATGDLGKVFLRTEDQLPRHERQRSGDRDRAIQEAWLQGKRDTESEPQGPPGHGMGVVVCLIVGLFLQRQVYKGRQYRDRGCDIQERRATRAERSRRGVEGMESRAQVEADGTARARLFIRHGRMV